MLKHIIHFYKMLFSSSYRESLKLENWFVVTWDDEFVYRHVSPPTGEGYEDKFRWVDIKRVCFEATSPYESDNLYIFTNQRPESYVIPLEAKNGEPFWMLVIDKGYFDEKLSVQAMLTPEGMFCYPSLDEK